VFATLFRRSEVRPGKWTFAHIRVGQIGVAYTVAAIEDAPGLAPVIRKLDAATKLTGASVGTVTPKGVVASK
jgi:hypothetical protein